MFKNRKPGRHILMLGEIRENRDGRLIENMLEKWKQNRLSEILRAHGEYITDSYDLLAGEPPSAFFYLFGGWYGKLLRGPSDGASLRRSVRWRRAIHPVLKRLVPLFMKEKQVVEDRNVLLGIPGKDKGIVLPEEPVIWAANHGFKDDIVASIAAASRHSLVVFGSLPIFYNTFDGASLALNGVVLMNRKSKKSSASVVGRAADVIRQGTDILIFPEGVWNKTPERLLLDLWPGVYRIARETGARVVPVVHYIEDASCRIKHNRIHTVVDEPMCMEGLTEEEGLRKLRDIMAGWYYLMMERYGQGSRAGELAGYGSAREAWEAHLEKRVGMCARYDRGIETCADYRPKERVEPGDVWGSIARIERVTPENAGSIARAAVILEEWHGRDFQRRF